MRRRAAGEDGWDGEILRLLFFMRGNPAVHTGASRRLSGTHERPDGRLPLQCAQHAHGLLRRQGRHVGADDRQSDLGQHGRIGIACLLYTSPSPRDA